MDLVTNDSERTGTPPPYLQMSVGAPETFDWPIGPAESHERLRYNISDHPAYEFDEQSFGNTYEPDHHVTQSRRDATDLIDDNQISFLPYSLQSTNWEHLCYEMPSLALHRGLAVDLPLSFADADITNSTSTTLTGTTVRDACSSSKFGQDEGYDDEIVFPTQKGSDQSLHTRPKKKKPATLRTKKPFACPYSRYDKERYSELNLTEKAYRGCSSSYLGTIPRLKQHLYRVHSRPKHYCSTCYTVFERRDKLESHWMRSEPCKTVDCPFQEKLNESQITAIKRKSHLEGAVETWYRIFAIIFPGSSTPASPYVMECLQEMDDFLAYFGAEAPMRLSGFLQDLLRDEHMPQLREDILEKVSTLATSQLLHSWRSSALSFAEFITDPGTDSTLVNESKRDMKYLTFPAMSRDGQFARSPDTSGGNRYIPISTPKDDYRHRGEDLSGKKDDDALLCISATGGGDILSKDRTRGVSGQYNPVFCTTSTFSDSLQGRDFTQIDRGITESFKLRPRDHRMQTETSLNPVRLSSSLSEVSNAGIDSKATPEHCCTHPSTTESSLQDHVQPNQHAGLKRSSYADSHGSPFSSLPSTHASLVPSLMTSQLAAERDVSDDTTDCTPESDGELSFMGVASANHAEADSVRIQVSQAALEIIACAVIDEYIRTLSTGHYGFHNSPSGESAGQGQLANASLSSPKSGSTNTSANKRKRGNKDEKDPDEGERDNKKPRWKPHPPRTDERLRLLACPYAKFDHARYSEQNNLVCEKDYRHCSSVYAQDMPRLKQHLYRVHLRPDFYCEVCFQDFQYGEERASHTRARTCVECVCPFEEKMNVDQQNKVKETVKGECTEASWYRVYRTLFTGPEPATPYSDGPWQQEVERLIQSFTEDGPGIYSGIISPLLNVHIPGLQVDQRAMLQIVGDLAVRELLLRLSSEPCVSGTSSAQRQPCQGTLSSDTQMSNVSQMSNIHVAIRNPHDEYNQEIEHPLLPEEPSSFLHSEDGWGNPQDRQTSLDTGTAFPSSGQHLISQDSWPSSEVFSNHLQSSSETVAPTTTYGSDADQNLRLRDWEEEFLDYDGHNQWTDATDVVIIEESKGKQRAS